MNWTLYYREQLVSCSHMQLLLISVFNHPLLAVLSFQPCNKSVLNLVNNYTSVFFHSGFILFHSLSNDSFAI